MQRVDVRWPLDGLVQPSVHLVRHAERVADLELARYKARFGRYLASQRGSRFGADLDQHWRGYWEVQRNRVLLGASADTLRCLDAGARHATSQRQPTAATTHEERRSRSAQATADPAAEALQRSGEKPSELMGAGRAA